MKRKIFFAIIVIIIIPIAYWMAAPLFFDKTVNEDITDILGPAQTTEQNTNQATTTSEIQTLFTGQFVGLANHNAEGTVKILEADGKNYVRFEDDFISTNGPDVFVYLGKDNKYDPESNLGAIKGNIGSQNYEIPDSIDLTQYNEVWIWCRAFSVPFGKAELN